MRIGTLYTLYGRRAGAEKLLEQTLFGLVSTYTDITFILYCNKEVLQCLPNHANIVKRYVPSLDNQYTKILWLQFGAISHLASDRVELFWIPSGSNSFPGPWRIPTLVTFLDFGEYHVPHKYDLKRTLYRKLFCIPCSARRGSAFTTISHSTANDLQRLFGKSSTVIYPSVSARSQQETSSCPAELVRQETGYDYESLILVPGRTDFYGKGLDILLHAYLKVIDQFTSAPPLVLAGPAGEQHGQLIKSIESMRLGSRVRWLGRVSDDCLDALYQLSSFVVFPSRYEGFGFPLLETMQHGKPVICSDAGSLPEVAGDAALFFPSGDSTALAASMARLIRETRLAQSLVAAGKKRVVEFSWQRNYSQMYTAFANLMGRAS